MLHEYAQTRGCWCLMPISVGACGCDIQVRQQGSRRRQSYHVGFFKLWWGKVPALQRWPLTCRTHCRCAVARCPKVAPKPSGNRAPSPAVSTSSRLLPQNSRFRWRRLGYVAFLAMQIQTSYVFKRSRITSLAFNSSLINPVYC